MTFHDWLSRPETVFWLTVCGLIAQVPIGFAVHILAPRFQNAMAARSRERIPPRIKALRDQLAQLDVPVNLDDVRFEIYADFGRVIYLSLFAVVISRYPFPPDNQRTSFDATLFLLLIVCLFAIWNRSHVIVDKTLSATTNGRNRWKTELQSELRKLERRLAEGSRTDGPRIYVNGQ
jgi:hypothetical protein